MQPHRKPPALDQGERAPAGALAAVGVVERAAGPGRGTAGEPVQDPQPAQRTCPQGRVAIADVRLIRIAPKRRRIDEAAAKGRPALVDLHHAALGGCAPSPEEKRDLSRRGSDARQADEGEAGEDGSGETHHAFTRRVLRTSTGMRS